MAEKKIEWGAGLEDGELAGWVRRAGKKHLQSRLRIECLAVTDLFGTPNPQLRIRNLQNDQSVLVTLDEARKAGVPDFMFPDECFPNRHYHPCPHCAGERACDLITCKDVGDWPCDREWCLQKRRHHVHDCELCGRDVIDCYDVPCSKQRPFRCHNCAAGYQPALLSMNQKDEER